MLWASRGRAIALGNHVFLPDHRAGDLATLAHELTHCGQYQAWGGWRYFARGAEARFRDLLHRGLGLGESPYAYRLEEGKPFDAYGMEQQGQIVEDSYRGDPAALAVSPYRPPADLGSRRGSCGHDDRDLERLGRAVGLIHVAVLGRVGKLVLPQRQHVPIGSATIAMMPQACWVGSATKRTPRSWSSPQ